MSTALVSTALVSTALVSCATVTSGVFGDDRVDMKVNSMPKGAIVSTSHGRQCGDDGITPCVISGLLRNQDFTVTLEREGCETATIDVVSKVGKDEQTVAKALNALSGFGVLGDFIDKESGTTSVLVPSKIDIELSCSTE